jgi:hypothetical protein
MTDQPDALLELLREAMTDDRMYRVRFRGDALGGKCRPNIDALETEVKKQAENIEKTVGCVTVVVRVPVDAFGPSEYEDVILFVLVPRHVDHDLITRVTEEARHRAMTNLTD